MHFSGDVWKNSCFKNFRRFPEKCLWLSSFKAIQAVQSITYKYTENWLHQKYFLWVFLEFLKVHSQVWDNFDSWNPFKNDEKCFMHGLLFYWNFLQNNSITELFEEIFKTDLKLWLGICF